MLSSCRVRLVRIFILQRPLDHSMRDLAFPHYRQIGTEPCQMFDLGVGVRPGHNFECCACSPCLLHDLAGLEGLRDSHKQPPRRREIGDGKHFWIGGIAHHHFRAIAAGRPDGSIDLIKHQQLLASRREAAPEERANSSVSDDHIVILERRHGEWRGGSGSGLR